MYFLFYCIFYERGCRKAVECTCRAKKNWSRGPDHETKRLCHLSNCKYLIIPFFFLFFFNKLFFLLGPDIIYSEYLSCFNKRTFFFFVETEFGEDSLDSRSRDPNEMRNCLQIGESFFCNRKILFFVSKLFIFFFVFNIILSCKDFLLLNFNFLITIFSNFHFFCQNFHFLSKFLFF